VSDCNPVTFDAGAAASHGILDSFISVGPGDERIETDRYTLCLGTGATVRRQRFAAAEVAGARPRA
jgi:hypothetical protein